MKKWLLILLVHFLPLLFCREVSWSFSGDGEGTETAPYIITDVMQLQEMNLDLEAHYVLNNDIDASSTISWNEDLGFGPIGDFSIPFTGSFNGNSHNITGLTINRTSMIGVGLFGYVEDATIEDVGIEGGYITGGSNVGALVGSNLRGIVIKCYASSHITGIGFGVGGLIGLNLNGTVADSYATGGCFRKGGRRWIGRARWDVHRLEQLRNRHGYGDWRQFQ
jgi:hypothetical protein